MPEGFKFQLSYGNAAIAGVGYQNLAQKLQSDLARVGIKAELTPMDQVNMRTMYPRRQARGGADLLEPAGAGELAVEQRRRSTAWRGRVHWKVPERRPQAGGRRGGGTRPGEGRSAVQQYQQAMVDAAHHFVLIQPVYQVAVRKSVSGLQLTAAGWMAELGGAKRETGLTVPRTR